MKKKKTLLILFLVLGILIIGDVAVFFYKENQRIEDASVSSTQKGPMASSYIINAQYDEQAHQLVCHMSVHLTNTTDEQMNEMYFNVWPQAMHPDQQGIELLTIKMNQEEVTYETNTTSLHMYGFSIQRGNTETITMDFIVHLPHDYGRFGWIENQVSLGNWFPILAVYDQKGWNTSPYVENGESFYSLSSDFQVTFDVPTDFQVIATGEETASSKQGKRKQTTFKADQVRDFAALFHTSLEERQIQLNKTMVSIYYKKNEEKYVEDMINSVEQSMDIYQSLFGPYPWKTLDVVSVDYSKEFYGGMEYPQLVMVNLPYLETEEERKLTIMHEVAHQWFYSMVGNDSYHEPWLDESFSTFASFVASGREKELETEEDGQKESPQEKCSYSIFSPMSVFQDRDIDCYEQVIYEEGARMLADLKHHIGDKAFYKGMRAYVKAFQFDVATTEDFINLMEASSKEDLRPFFASYGREVKNNKK